MDIKLFLSTFLLIFLNECGDKTQLAAMAQSANGKWTVFFAASTALVLSTLLAVLVGDGLTKILPGGERTLKLLGGLLFIGFGIYMLYGWLRNDNSIVKHDEISNPTELNLLIIKPAICFEKHVIEECERLIKSTNSSTIKKILLNMINDDCEHIESLKSLMLQTYPSSKNFVAPTFFNLELHSDVTGKIIEHLIEEKEKISAFYKSISENTAFVSFAAIFHNLTQAEQQHVDQLHHIAKEFSL